MSSTFLSKKRATPLNADLPKGYSKSVSNLESASRNKATASAVGGLVGGGAALLTGNPALIAPLAGAGSSIFSGIAEGQQAEAEAAFAAETAAQELAFAKMAFNRLAKKDDDEYDDAMEMQRVENTFNRLDDTEPYARPPIFEVGR
jgi:hypothetical protein